MNTMKLSRRRLLAGVPAVAATMAPAAATVAGLALAPTVGLAATTTEVDPIFPLIERHRAAEAERKRLLDLMWATYDRLPESIRGRIGGKVDIGLFVSPS